MEGGFGQYYKATLAELGLIDITDEPPGIQLVRGYGTQVAGLCDQQPGRDKFWQAVVADRVSFNEIKELGDYVCPCALLSFHEERDFLRQLLFGAAGDMDQQTRRRADSFQLLLSYLNQSPDGGDPWKWYRQTAYYGHNASGKPFEVPRELVKPMSGWAVYQAGEYVNRALEEVFLAVLRKLQVGRSSVDSFAAGFSREALRFSSKELGLGKTKKAWADRLLVDLVNEAKVGQGPAGQWPDERWSEEQLIGRAAKEIDPDRKTAFAFGSILSVLARTCPQEPYTAFETLGGGFQDRHAVNLASVAQFIRERQNESTATAVAALVKEMVLIQHLRVAMRKLRYQAQATFKYVVEYGQYVWVEDFDPTFTSPRLRQAFLFLRDLGLAKGRADGWGLTKDGAALLRHRNGH
jgi:hypothetical protein